MRVSCGSDRGSTLTFGDHATSEWLAGIPSPRRAATRQPPSSICNKTLSFGLPRSHRAAHGRHRTRLHRPPRRRLPHPEHVTTWSPTRRLPLVPHCYVRRRESSYCSARDLQRSRHLFSWIHLPASNSRGSCKTGLYAQSTYNTRKKITSRNTNIYVYISTWVSRFTTTQLPNIEENQWLCFIERRCRSFSSPLRSFRVQCVREDSSRMRARWQGEAYSRMASAELLRWGNTTVFLFDTEIVFVCGCVFLMHTCMHYMY